MRVIIIKFIIILSSKGVTLLNYEEIRLNPKYLEAYNNKGFYII